MDGRALFMGTPIFYEGVFIYMRTYYETLGVSADAKTDEIRKNYRRLVKENHPDLHPGDKAAEERFKEIAEAWETLGDEEKRKKYDAEIAKVKKGGKAQVCGCSFRTNRRQGRYWRNDGTVQQDVYSRRSCIAIGTHKSRLRTD